MADKRCENGHFIDESWDLCPYCPAENAEQEVPVVRPTRSMPQADGPEGRPPRAVAQPEPVRAAAAPAAAVPRRETPPAQPPPMERTISVQMPKGEGGAATPAKRYVVGWLVELSGPTRGEAHPVRMGRNVLGRDRRSDIVVEDDQASSHHADLVFRPEERRFILMDHNSTNGTYVNEAEIEPRRDLAEKDVIRIGSRRLLFMPLCQDGFHWDDEGALQ